MLQHRSEQRHAGDFFYLIKALRDVTLYSSVVLSSKLSQACQQVWSAGGHKAWCDNRLDALIPQVPDPLQEGLCLCQCLLCALLIPLCAVSATFLNLLLPISCMQ